MQIMGVQCDFQVRIVITRSRQTLCECLWCSDGSGAQKIGASSLLERHHPRVHQLHQFQRRVPVGPETRWEQEIRVASVAELAFSGRWFEELNMKNNWIYRENEKIIIFQKFWKIWYLGSENEKFFQIFLKISHSKNFSHQNIFLNFSMKF